MNLTLFFFTCLIIFIPYAVIGAPLFENNFANGVAFGGVLTLLSSWVRKLEPSKLIGWLEAIAGLCLCLSNLWFKASTASFLAGMLIAAGAIDLFRIYLPQRSKQN